MLTLYTKERLARPELSTITEGKIPVKTSSAVDKLMALDPENLEISDDSDDDYSGSDISDPFKDVQNCGSIEKDFEKAKKRLTKLEQSLQLMASFSDDFQKAMDEAREELKLQAKQTYTSIDEMKTNQSKFNKMEELSKTFEEKMNKIFRDEEYLNCGQDLDIPEPVSVEPEKCFDIMSGMWKMMETSDSLIATPPNYNTFNQQSPHWLDRNGISWTSMDNATDKCEQWMKTQNNSASTSKLRKPETKDSKE